MTTLDLVPTPDSAELLVVGVYTDPEGPRVAAAPGLSADVVDALTSAARAVGASGKPDEVLRLPGSGVGQPPVMLTGLGAHADHYDAETLRRAAGAALRLAPARVVALALPTEGDPELVEAAAAGALIGAYRYPGRPATDPPTAQPESVLVVGSGALDDALRRAAIIGEAVCLAKLLVDTPPNDLPPAVLAAKAVDALDGTPTEVEVLDEDALVAAGFGGILAVGKGSANPPRLVRITYAPEGAVTHLGLVGKGITFDSGGLSLKPPASMVTMKSDMAGAAAVLGAVRAVSQLGVPVRITAYLALAENMPSGSAARPGDVITAYGGRTVEVLNTDAEGRLVMMDALVRCAEDGPDALVDIATLTAHQIIALGHRVAGVMGNDDTWRDEVVASAVDAGELAWAMPIPEELRASLDSPVADLANIGERNGGMLTAAAFLRDFVPAGLPWAHVDFAGPSFLEGTPWGYTGVGATGFGVRTLVRLAQRFASVQ